MPAGTSLGSDAGTQGRRLEPRRILQPHRPRLGKTVEARVATLEARVPTQELRHVLSNALDAGRSRIHETHRRELLTALEGIKSERSDHFSPALRRLYEVTQKPITP